MENKGKNKGLIGLVIVLIILVLSLGGYIVYDKVIEKENNKKENKNITEKKEEKKEELSITSEEVTGLMKKISITDIDTSLTGWYYQKDKITVDDMDNQIKLIIGLQDNYDVEEEFQENRTISKEDIRNSIKKILGDDIKYQDENINSSCYGTAANYNEKTKQYELTGGCGGVLIPLYKEKISKAYQTDKTIEIYQKAIYVEFESVDEEGIKENIYKTDRKTEIKKGILSEEDMDYSKYFDLSDEFKFTFTKQGNNYYFSSVEKVK